MTRYSQIKELYEFCKEHEVKCELETLFDGYVIKFNHRRGGDVVQHRGSYGSQSGMLEFGFTGYDEVDFKPVTLTEAKDFIARHKMSKRQMMKYFNSKKEQNND